MNPLRLEHSLTVLRELSELRLADRRETLDYVELVGELRRLDSGRKLPDPRQLDLFNPPKPG